MKEFNTKPTFEHLKINLENKNKRTEISIFLYAKSWEIYSQMKTRLEATEICLY